MSDLGFIKNGAEQRPEAATAAEILAEYTEVVRQNLTLLRSLGELSHPSAARMAIGISVQPVPEQQPAVVVPIGDSAEARAARARQTISGMPEDKVQIEDIDYEIAA